MNTETITIEFEPVKPCIKCGARERNKRGACLPCKREGTRKWAQLNLDRVREKNRNWYLSNLENLRESRRKYREENASKIQEQNRKYQKNCADKKRESNRKWQESNPEKVRAKHRRWTKSNLDKIRIKCQNRRARIIAAGGTLSKDIVQRLFGQQNGKCACCKADLSKTGYHLDHIMPLALGGTNTDDNVQLLTPTCNLRKGAKHPHKWERLIS
jgi:5-methylcytosine-specific restriction endonuclease McrA